MPRRDGGIEGLFPPCGGNCHESQELQHARRRAEVAEAIAARCEAAKAAASGSSRSPSASPPEASPKPKAPSPARSGSTPGAGAALPRSAKARAVAPRRGSRSSRGQGSGATSEGEKELRRDSEKFSYNRTLAMLKFSENRTGARPGSAMTSATSSLASLHRDESAALPGVVRSSLSPAVGGPGSLTPRDKKSRFLLA